MDMVQRNGALNGRVQWGQWRLSKEDIYYTRLVCRKRKEVLGRDNSVRSVRKRHLYKGRARLRLEKE